MISKANSRQTTYGEVKFRYKVSLKPKSKGVYEFKITVQSEEHNGSKLLVTGILQHDQLVIPPEDYKCLPEIYKWYPEIIKGDINGFICEAIGLGWVYGAAGTNFILQASNAIFMNPFRGEKPEGFYHGRFFQAKR